MLAAARALEARLASVDATRLRTGRLADELRDPLDRGLRDALNHPAALVGYLDGHEARTRLRDGLLAELPGYGWFGHHKTLLARMRAGAAALVRVFGELESREHLTPVPGAPTHPGPARTLEVALQHLQQLTQKVALLET